jgi:hypothetical protein
MKKISSIALPFLLITISGHQAALSNKEKFKNKSSYVVLKIDGREYGQFGIKEDVPFVNDSTGKSTAGISLGPEGLAVTVINGDVTKTRGTILNLFLKNAVGTGGYSFDGLTISGYDGSGTNLNYRTGDGDTKFFYYSSDEKLNRKPQGGKSCKTEKSGLLGKTEVKIIQFTRNATNPKGVIEGNFSARLNGNSVKDVDDCQSDRVLNISGYFYVNN